MAEKLLELKNISKRFGGVQALDNVGFDIKKQRDTLSCGGEWIW
nr:hypothetical protein [Kosmotoga sp. DU53]